MVSWNYWTKRDMHIYHLKIPASRSTLNKIRASADIINDWPFKPWDHKVSPFRVYLNKENICYI